MKLDLSAAGMDRVGLDQRFNGETGYVLELRLTDYSQGNGNSVTRLAPTVPIVKGATSTS